MIDIWEQVVAGATCRRVLVTCSRGVRRAIGAACSVKNWKSLRRPLIDLGTQLAPIVATLVERILLTALVVQRLGVERFEMWSLILATVTILTLVDLGTRITFSNRMSAAANRGDVARAILVYRESNTIFLGLGALIFGLTLVFAFWTPVQQLLGFDRPLDRSEQAVAACLGLGIAVRMALANASAVYRVNLAFARGTVIVAASELARAMAMVVAVIVWPSLLSPAIATAAVSVAAFGILIPIDLARSYGDYKLAFNRPTAISLHRALPESAMFATSYLPNVVLVQIPVMLVGSRSASGVLAAFVLMRTIANSLRSLTQSFLGVIGMELGRLESQGRMGELRVAYSRLSLLVSISFGAISGFAWSWGDMLVAWWTGRPELFDSTLLAIMLAPLVITPVAQLTIPFLTYAHRPERVAASIVAEVLAVILLAFAIPVQSIAMRVSLAISGGEILALAPIAYASANQIVGGKLTRFATINIIVSLGTAGAVGAVVMLVRIWSDSAIGLFCSAFPIAVLVGAPTALLMVRFVGSMRDSRRNHDMTAPTAP